jgi:3-hydroxyisobutyrate dehydrogenase
MYSVAFLGLGTMGAGMASRLIDQGFPLTVWNRRRERADAFSGRDARVASTPREAAAGAAVIVSMVADDGASRDVWLGADGALAGAAPGTIVIESSTLSPVWIDELDAAAGVAKCTLLDAPVTGSKTQAASGQLRFLVGGPAAALERARPALAAMSQEILHLGPIGAGAKLKLINNFFCGVQAAGLAEAVAFIEASGLDRDAALSVLANGAPGSPLVKAVGPRMANADYAVNFNLALMHKDLSYASAEAAREGVALTTADTARALFQKAIVAGHGDKDFSAIVEVLRQKA